MPMRSLSTGAGSAPACSIASLAARVRNLALGAMNFSFLGRRNVEVSSNSGTHPYAWAEQPERSSRADLPIADSPASARLHAFLTDSPEGTVSPMPVTAMLELLPAESDLRALIVQEQNALPEEYTHRKDKPAAVAVRQASCRRNKPVAAALQ